ncbi:hypothetical protein L1887_16245 [Cichorium endivia]|nr:hypothetical protein L1887_16245 [Cichorium endivia]
MTNSEINTIDLGNNVTATATATFHKQPILATKKVALRDVQNKNSNLPRDTHPAILLPVEGQSFMDSAKISGIKRHTPDYTTPPLLNNNSQREHINYPRRKYESDGNRGRNSNYNVASKYTASKASVPRFKESNDDQMTERFIRLQNFIKQCDGSNHRENIQLLLRLSPMELSRHAVELEKRAIQLTIEEGQEMQRMQALNILGNPSATRNSMPITQHKN